MKGAIPSLTNCKRETVVRSHPKPLDVAGRHKTFQSLRSIGVSAAFCVWKHKDKSPATYIFTMNSLTHEELQCLISECKSKAQVLKRMGLNPKRTHNYKKLNARVKELHCEWSFARHFHIVKDVSKKDLQNHLDSSCSLWETLKSLGVGSTTQHYYDAIRIRIRDENLSLVKMKENAKKRAPIHHRRLSLQDILCVGSKVSNQSLKAKLIKFGLKEDKCAKCGLGPIWQGAPLVLQLDHINGDSRDNRLPNLRILCPNCHSQTDTFAGKNQANRERDKTSYHCPDCGKSIHRGSQRCDTCARKARPKKLLVSSSDLYDLVHVQKMPFTKIGERFGVSDNAIRKRCRKLNISVPKRGD